MERNLPWQVSFHLGNSAVPIPQARPCFSIMIHHQLKMGVQVGKELSTIVLEACEAAEQAGEQQLDETFSHVVCPIISAGSLCQTASCGDMWMPLCKRSGTRSMPVHSS